MIRIPLNFLPTFVVVAQTQNLRAAADSLHLTHSAVSQQIGALEERLGFSLFDRRGRRVVLNAAGEALLRHVAPALGQVDDGVQAAGRSRRRRPARPARDDAAVVRCSAGSSPRLGLWRRARHPDIPIEIEASVNSVLDLQREGFHAAIRTGGAPVAGPRARASSTTRPRRSVAVASPPVAQRLHMRACWPT